jgi:type I restriction enzyme M protein
VTASSIQINKQIVSQAGEILRGSAIETSYISDLLLQLIFLKATSQNAKLLGLPKETTVEWSEFLQSGVDSQELIKQTLMRLASDDKRLKHLIPNQFHSRYLERDLTRVIYTLDNLHTTFQDLETLAAVLGPLAEFLLEPRSNREGYDSTPRASAKLTSLIVRAQSGDDVYDPACGTATQLIYVAESMNSVHIYGQDFNMNTLSTATMSLFMHGILNFELCAADTLIHPAFTDGNRLKTFDAIVVNPPANVPVRDEDRLSHDPYGRFRFGKIPKRSSEWLFVQHVLASLKPQGRAAILSPAGLLFRGGAELEIRRNVTRGDFIEAIIGLPRGTFAHSVALEGLVMVLNLNKPQERHGKVLMVDVSDFGNERGRIGTLEEDFVKVALHAYQYGDDVPGRSRLVDLSELDSNDYNLNPKQYLRKYQPIEAIDPSILEAEIAANEARVEQAKTKLEHAWKALRENQ